MAAGRILLAAALLGGCAAPGPGVASRLEREIRLALAARAPEAKLRLWLAEVEGGELLAVDADLPVAAASTVKVLVLLEAHARELEGTFNWGEEYALRDADRAGGSGSLRREREGSTWSYAQLARRMIAESDNTASNVLLRRLRMAEVNRRARSLGLSVTRIERGFMDEAARREGKENRTTAREMGMLFMWICRKEILTPEACGSMIELLERTSRGRIAAGVPADVPVGHKGGSLPGHRHDVGWVRLPGRPYILSVFLEGVMERPGSGEDRGAAAIEAISAAVYRSLGPSDE